MCGKGTTFFSFPYINNIKFCFAINLYAALSLYHTGLFLSFYGQEMRDFCVIKGDLSFFIKTISQLMILCFT